MLIIYRTIVTVAGLEASKRVGTGHGDIKRSRCALITEGVVHRAHSHAQIGLVQGYHGTPIFGTRTTALMPFSLGASATTCVCPFAFRQAH